MSIYHIIRSALTSMWTHRLRSALAMLGIIIGTAALIAMLSTGSGIRRQVMYNIARMGTNLLIIRPGQVSINGVKSGSRVNLTLSDAQSLRAQIEHIVAVAPIVSADLQIKYANQNTRSRVVGTTPSYLPARNFHIDRGRVFTDVELETSVCVALIGPDTAVRLFGRADPVNQTIRIKDVNFQVIGVLKPKGDHDDQVVVPIHVAISRLFGPTLNRPALDEIVVEADQQERVEQVRRELVRVLRQLHRMTPDQPEDFSIRTETEIIEFAVTLLGAFQLLLGSVGLTLMTVGGIGIMNIMLVTVSERTKEIGIRKAVGARNCDILYQFLAESVCMSGLGGLGGATLGLTVTRLISRLTVFSTDLQSWFVILAVGFAALIGIFFGFYPAYRAAQLSPIDALRYE